MILSRVIEEADGEMRSGEYIIGPTSLVFIWSSTIRVWPARSHNNPCYYDCPLRVVLALNLVTTVIVI
jgi:hypothetical protein